MRHYSQLRVTPQGPTRSLDVVSRGPRWLAYHVLQPMLAAAHVRVLPPTLGDAVYCAACIR